MTGFGFDVPDDLRVALAELDRDLLEQQVLKLGCALAAMVIRHGFGEPSDGWTAQCRLSSALDPDNMRRQIDFQTDVEYDLLHVTVRPQVEPARRL